MKKQGGSSRKPCLQKCHYLFFEDLFKTRSTFGHFGEVTVIGLDSSQPELEEGHIGRVNYGWIESILLLDGFKVFALYHHLISIPRTGRDNYL